MLKPRSQLSSPLHHKPPGGFYTCLGGKKTANEVQKKLGAWAICLLGCES